METLGANDHLAPFFMANQIRIKRRASSGSAGAPASLLNAELAYNEADNILYYGYGDNGSGVATSVVAIAGSGNNVTVGTEQTITGNKTFSGDVDLTGAFKLDGVEVTVTAAELNHLAGLTEDVVSVHTEVRGDIVEVRSAVGIADGESDYGTATAAGFTGNTIRDDASVKEALIDVEAALEGSNSDAVDLRTLSGTADGDTDLGTFAGSVITDAGTTKAALGELEAELEKAEGIIGTAVGDTNMGTYGGSGSILTDSGTVKAALEELEAAIEDGSGTTTTDSGSASYDAGNINILGGTGLSTSGDGNSTVTITLDDTAVTPGNYGRTDKSASITVDQQGRITSLSHFDIHVHDRKKCASGSPS